LKATRDPVLAVTAALCMCAGAAAETGGLRVLAAQFRAGIPHAGSDALRASMAA